MGPHIADRDPQVCHVDPRALFVGQARGYQRAALRTMFAVYWLVIVTGVLTYLVVGLTVR
jgi:hypothetical protein